MQGTLNKPFLPANEILVLFLMHVCYSEVLKPYVWIYVLQLIYSDLLGFVVWNVVDVSFQKFHFYILHFLELTTNCPDGIMI